MARKMKKLTVARLRAWLESQPPDAKFNTRDSLHCPIAEYIDEDHRVFSTQIVLHGEALDNTILPDSDSRVIPLPEWAKRFINKVDYATADGTSTRGYALRKVYVTRDEAIKFLDEAVKEKGARK